VIVHHSNYKKVRSEEAAELHSFIMEYINTGQANFMDRTIIKHLREATILEKSIHQYNLLHDVIHILFKKTNDKILSWDEASHRCYTLLTFIFKHGNPAHIYELMRKQDIKGYHPVSHIFCFDKKCSELYFDYILYEFPKKDAINLIDDLLFNAYQNGNLRLFLCSATRTEDLQRYFNTLHFCYNNGLLQLNQYDLEYLYINISNTLTTHDHFIINTLSLLNTLAQAYSLNIDYSKAFQSNTNHYNFLHALLTYVYTQNTHRKSVIIEPPKGMSTPIFIKKTLVDALFHENTPPDFA
jgi:hypothetical protein